MEKQATKCTHTSQKFVNNKISFVKSCPDSNFKMLESFKKWLSIMYLRYEIITCSELLSPYEKVLISKFLRHELFVDIDNKIKNCF